MCNGTMKNILAVLRNKCISGLFFILLFALLVSMPVMAELDDAHTKDQKIIFIELDKNRGIGDVKVVRDNYFYRYNQPYTSAFEEVDDITTPPVKIEVLEAGNDVIDWLYAYTGMVYFPFYVDISKIRVYDAADENKIIAEKSISFCNNNNICEPCEGKDCSLSENSATCNDCSSGSSDKYCDLKKDNICDPDCNNIDMDCSGCTAGKCYYDDTIDEKSSCNDVGGEVCFSVDECAGNPIGYGGEGICCIGNCVDPTVDEEYIVPEPKEIEFTGGSDFVDELVDTPTDPVQLFNLNYNKSIPIEDDSRKVLCSKVGKTTCEFLEKCIGERVDSDDEGYDCCTGYCVPLPEGEFKDAYKKAFGEDYTEKIEKPKAPEKFVFAPEITKASPLWLLLLLIPATIIIFMIVSSEKRKADREKRLEYEYKYYKNYGYTEEQLKNILKERGWKDNEIKKVVK